MPRDIFVRTSKSSDISHQNFLAKLLAELASEFGAVLVQEPQYGYVGYLEFPHRRRFFFRGTSFDLNPQGASAIAEDKDYCARLLSHFGYRVPTSVLLFAPRYRHQMQLRNEKLAEKFGFEETALAFAGARGFPLFLKPNEGSEGRGVYRVTSIEEMFEALSHLFDRDDKILLEAPVPGRDYRIVVLDGEVLSAYERRPLGVTGDGEATVRALAAAAIAALRRARRGARIHVDDPRIAAEVRAQGLSMEFVPERGRRIDLLPNANLSTGGEAVDVSDQISAFHRDLAVAVAKDLGLVLSGIDLMAEDIAASRGDYCILEVNASPGLNHFAGTSREAEARTRQLYRRVLAKMARMAGR